MLGSRDGGGDGRVRSPDDSSLRHGDIRQGFVYQRVPHITLKSIANNAEIDVIWERWQETLEPLRGELNDALGRTWEAWEIPREPGDPRAGYSDSRPGTSSVPRRPSSLGKTVGDSLNRALNRHYALDGPSRRPPRPVRAGRYRCFTRGLVGGSASLASARLTPSIAAKADFEYLYDKPYEDSRKVRVAGPFTVESLSPHRVLGHRRG